MQFLCAFQNNAQNDDDIKAGAELMKLYDIKMKSPTWGASKGEFFFDEETRTIYKGLTSVKYMGEA